MATKKIKWFQKDGTLLHPETEWSMVTNKPAIPNTSNFVTLDTEQTITARKTIEGSLVLNGSFWMNGEGDGFPVIGMSNNEMDMTISPGSISSGSAGLIFPYGDNGGHDLYLPDENGTLATMEWVEGLFSNIDTSKFVNTTGNQFISGVKTFDTSILVDDTGGVVVEYGSGSINYEDSNNEEYYQYEFPKKNGTFLVGSSSTPHNSSPTRVATFLNNSAGAGIAYSTIEEAMPKRLKPDTGNGVSDPNTISAAGFYYVKPGSTSRIPPFKQVDGATADDYRIISHMSSDSTYQVQIAIDVRSNDLFARRNQNGTWKDWTAYVKMPQGAKGDALCPPTDTVAVFDNERNATIKGSGVKISSLATTSYVDTKVSGLVNSAPATLDTLNELAKALGNDPNFATTVATNIGGKVSKSGDTMTGTLYVPDLQSIKVTASSVNKNTSPKWVATFNNDSAQDGFAASTVEQVLPQRLREVQGKDTGNHAVNSLYQNGFYYVDTANGTNRPPFKQVDNALGTDYRVLVTGYSDAWAQQIATDFRSNDIFTRRIQNGTWQGWTALVKMPQGASATELLPAENTIPVFEGTRNATIKSSGVKIGDLAKTSALSSYLPLSGGTLTGNLKVGSATIQTNGYITGTWLQTTSTTTHLTTAATKVAVLDGSGWIYHRTPSEILSDIAALPLAGGTMTGRLKFAESACSDADGPSYLLAMTSFSSGGEVKYTHVRNLTSKGNLQWTSATHTNATGYLFDGNYIPTINTLAYWNGAYQNTSSNLTYCAGGEILSKSGGTLTASAQLQRAGISKTWVKGREAAIIRTTSAGSTSSPIYAPIFSQKSANGSWEFGAYTNDIAHLSYVKDTDYTANNNVQTADYQFPANKKGTVAVTSDLAAYLPLAGGTMTGRLVINKAGTGQTDAAAGHIALQKSGTEYAHIRLTASNSNLSIESKGGIILYGGTGDSGKTFSSANYVSIYEGSLRGNGTVDISGFRKLAFPGDAYFTSTSDIFRFGIPSSENEAFVIANTGGTTFIRPGKDNTMDLGNSSNSWKNLYLKGTIIHGGATLTLPSTTGTIALKSDIPSTRTVITITSDGGLYDGAFYWSCSFNADDAQVFERLGGESIQTLGNVIMGTLPTEGKITFIGIMDAEDGHRYTNIIFDLSDGVGTFYGLQTDDMAGGYMTFSPIGYVGDVVIS